MVLLWNKQLVEASSFTIEKSVPLDILTSATIPNDATKNSFRVYMKYETLLPAEVFGSYRIETVIDFMDDQGEWQLVPAYQGNPLRGPDQAAIRVIIIQPTVGNLNLGDTDIFQIGGRTVAETNRHALTVLDRDLRVRVVMTEGFPGGIIAWQAVVVSGMAEVYNS